MSERLLVAKESRVLYNLVFGSNVVSMFNAVQEKVLVCKMNIHSSKGGGEFPGKLFDGFY